MVFWTHHGGNLDKDARMIRPYSKRIHFTLTGWTEVEHRAPNISNGVELLRALVGEFGLQSVNWRFSPVPLVDDVLFRFARIADEVAGLGLPRVYVSFLQENDQVAERRTADKRRNLLASMAALTDLEIVLCNEDQETLAATPGVGRVRRGICESGQGFSASIETERCGCALAVDPFTRNEACVYACEYCYSADLSGAPKKRNTTLATLRRSR